MPTRAGTRSRSFWPKRVGLATLMALASVNIWTGGPLLALWLGSRVQNGEALSMGTVFAVIVTLGAIEFGLAVALTRLGGMYDAVTGRPSRPRQRATWLRSLRDESSRAEVHASELRAVEKVMVASVVLAVVAFEIWFFFFAGSSLPRAG